MKRILFLAVFFVVVAVVPAAGAGDEYPGIDCDVTYRFLGSGFIPNAGQYDPAVEYILQHQGTTIFFTRDGLVLTHAPDNASMDIIRQSFAGASPDTHLSASGRREGVVNYYVGNDSSKWLSDIPVYSEVIYEDLYPGIDLVYTEEGGRLKREFSVSPGADPSEIELLYEGESEPHVDEDGVLRFTSPAGEMLESPLICWQVIDGERVDRVAEYVVDGGSVRIRAEEYDAGHGLIIDPELVYSSYLGGGGYDEGRALASDGAGGVWVAGTTLSEDFPLRSEYQSSYGGGEWDVFVSHFSSSGSLISSTYLGGRGWDEGHALAGDGAGGVWVAGYTDSTDFPLWNECQSNHGGYTDAFVVHFSSDGTLISSTYLGGSEHDSGYALANDDEGGIWVAGNTDSIDFPLWNEYQSNHGGDTDAFVVHFSSDGTLISSTYLGGGDGESGSALAGDGAGGVWITGYTRSTDFPVTEGAYQSNHGGGEDAFVAHFSSDGTLISSTYLGGSYHDSGYALANDDEGGIWVAGTTDSTDFPLQNEYQSDYGGGGDIFVAHFSSSSTLISSTYLGGEGYDYGPYFWDAFADAFVSDGSGGVWIAGTTSSEDFPLLNEYQNSYGGGERDAFITHLSSSGNLISSTYLGGRDWEYGSALVGDGTGGVWVTGYTYSEDFPTQSAYQSSFGRGSDAFTAHFSSSGALISSTYLGGKSYDYGYALADDGAGGVWIAGTTSSEDFPLRNEYQDTCGRGSDVFLARFGSSDPVYPPTADFTANVTAGPAPLTVRFTDKSTGSPDSWLWRFGDGDTSTEMNPKHTYTSEGYYDVTLTVCSATGKDSVAKERYIAVFNDTPQNDFDVTAYYCVYNSELDGTQTVTKTISGNSYTLKASFLYGGYGVVMQGIGRTRPTGDYIRCTNPSSLVFVHTNNPAEFTDEIRQRYTDLGITDFTGFGNLAVNRPDLASFSVVPEHIGAAGRVLEPWQSVAVDHNVIPLGTTGVLVFKGGETTPEGASSMVFCADDTGGGIKGRRINIYVGEGEDAMQEWWDTGGNRRAGVSLVPVQLKSADFTADITSGTAPLTVRFTDRSTGNPTSYLWDFGDNEGTSTKPNPSHTYTEVGIFEVSLTVTGAYGSDTKSKCIEVFAPQEGTVTVSKSGNVDDATATWTYPTHYAAPVFRRGLDNPSFLADLNGDMPKDYELLFEIYCPDYSTDPIGSIYTDDASGATWKWTDTSGNSLNVDSIPIGIYHIDALIVDRKAPQTKYEIGTDTFYVTFDFDEQDMSFVTLSSEQSYVKDTDTFEYVPLPSYNLHIWDSMIWKPALTEASGSTRIADSVEQISELARSINGKMVFHHTACVENTPRSTFLSDGYDNDFDGIIDEPDEAWEQNYHMYNANIDYDIVDSNYVYKIPPELGKAYYIRETRSWSIIPPWLHQNKEIVWVDGSGNEYPNNDDGEFYYADTIAWYRDTVKMINEDFDPENKMPSPNQHSLGVCEDYAMLTVGYLRAIGVSSRVACGAGTQYWIPWGPHAWTQWKDNDPAGTWKHLDVSFIPQRDSWEQSKYDPDVYNCKWDYVLVRNSEDIDDVSDISSQYNAHSIEMLAYNESIDENVSKTYVILGNPKFYPGDVTTVDLEISNNLDMVVNSTIVVELISGQPISTADTIAVTGQYKDVIISNHSTIYEAFELKIPSNAFPSTNYMLNVYDVSDEEKLVLSKPVSIETLFTIESNVQSEIVLNASFQFDLCIQNVGDRTLKDISIDIGVGDAIQTNESIERLISTLEPGQSENVSWNLISVKPGSQQIKTTLSCSNGGSLVKLLPIHVLQPADLKMMASVLEMAENNSQFTILADVSNSGDFPSAPVTVALSLPDNISSNTTMYQLDPIQGHGSQACAFELFHSKANDFSILINASSGGCIVEKSVYLDVKHPELFIDIYREEEDPGIDPHTSTINLLPGRDCTLFVYLRNIGDMDLTNITLETNTGLSREIPVLEVDDEEGTSFEFHSDVPGQGILNVMVSSDEIEENFSRPYVVEAFTVNVALPEHESFINTIVPIRVSVLNDMPDTKFNDLTVTSTIRNTTHEILHNKTTISLLPLEVYNAEICWDTSGSLPGNYTVATLLTIHGREVVRDEIRIYLIGNIPPTAAFTANRTSGTLPLAVLFTDTSSGSPSTWLWSFGDGATSTNQNPVHTYTAPGNYTVNLTATNAGGSSTETRPDYITVTIRGDFNGNGEVDIGDVSKVAWMVVGKEPADLAADFNGNGRVDIGDAAKIAYYFVGKIGEL